MARQNYEPINDTAGVSFGGGSSGGQDYGGARSYQSIEMVDAENPFGASRDVRVTHHRLREDSSRRQFLWWVLAPAISLLLVIAVAVAVASQSAVPLPSSPGSVNMPALGAAGPLSTGPLPPTYAMLQDEKTTTSLPVNAAVVGDDDDSVAPAADPQKPGPGMNATTVLSCLEDKCEPFVTQLGKSWRELANINLLRCLTSSAFNKTAASVCFKSAGPSELRDNLVACAGCNKCVKLNDQANIDQACAKYKAWAAKKAAAADDTAAPSPDDDTTTTSPAMEKAVGPPAADSLAAGLPKSLRESFCSQYWCP